MKPVHPLLVHFPIALLPLSVAADALAALGGVTSMRDTGWWAMAAAAVAGVVTAAAGYFDMTRAPIAEEVHRRVHRHMRIGFVLVACLLGLATWRARIFAAGDVVPMIYLDLGVLTFALAALQGWLGGELVYSDGVAVRAAEASSEAGATEGETGAETGGHHH